MKSGKIFLCTLLVLFFCVAGCRDDKKKGDFSGVSELIVNRNQARFNITRQKALEKDSARKQSSDKAGANTVADDKNLATVVLYPKKIKIISSQSQQVLAHGTAYINKQGRIVKIKIKQN